MKDKINIKEVELLQIPYTFSNSFLSGIYSGENEEIKKLIKNNRINVKKLGHYVIDNSLEDQLFVLWQICYKLKITTIKL